jgi:predicted transcriptional regulator of viral defense system
MPTVKPAAKHKQVMQLVRRLGIARPRDARADGLPGNTLWLLARRGLLEQRGRGMYALADHKYTEHHSLAEAAKRVPQGTICLLSALRAHALTTQAPHEVWIAIDRKARLPKSGAAKLRVVRFSGKALTEGIERRGIEGVTVPIYNVAKTVADCFKYRNKIGLDVALEALREAWRGKRCTSKELWKYADICRVANVMHALSGEHDLIQAPIKNLAAIAMHDGAHRILGKSTNSKERYCINTDTNIDCLSASVGDLNILKWMI